MTGYFIYNKYLNNSKFQILRQAFEIESKAININLIFIDNYDAYFLLFENKLLKVDFVLFWDKDIKLAKLLENKGFKLFNNSKAISICDDKSKTYIELLNHNINQATTIISPLIYFGDLSNDSEFIDNAILKLGFPMIVKECYGSFGEQVYLSNNKDELILLLKKIGTKPFILQEFIKNSFGRDIRIEVIGNEITATVNRINKNNDFRANITNGAIAYNYVPNNEQIQMALDVCKIINLDFAGVDILFGDCDEPILCEVNSNAYPLNVQKVTGVNIVKKTLEYIKFKRQC